MKKKENNFYVYVYLDPRKPGKYVYKKYSFSFEPFYVGKGRGSRFKDHLNEINNEYCVSEKRKILVNILSSGFEPIIVKYKENISENDAFCIEKDMILSIGRSILNIGPLVNIHEGGQGFSGWVPSENWIKNNKEGQIKRWKKKENRTKHSISIKKSFDNPITKEKLRNTTRTRWKKNREEMLSYQKLDYVKDKKSKSSIEKLSKTWILISPENQRFITNRLGEFCKKYGLCINSIHAIANGKKISYKGWICFKDGKENETIKRIEELKKRKIENKKLQNFKQVGKHIHTEQSKKKIGEASKGNRYGLNYKHTKEELDKISSSSILMWKKRKQQHVRNNNLSNRFFE